MRGPDSDSDVPVLIKLANTAGAIGIIVGLIAGFAALFAAAVGIFGKLPNWAAIPLTFGSLVLLLVGAVSLADHLKKPRSWLVLAAVGAVIVVAPLLVLAVQGSWDTEFTVPRRLSRNFVLEVQEFASIAIPIGFAYIATGLVAYFRPRRVKRTGTESRQSQ